MKDPVFKDGVRQEATGWRDQAISARHRLWGVGCPATDIDFLLVETNYGEPAAIVDYKRTGAEMHEPNHPSIKALLALADDRPRPIPLLIVFYSSPPESPAWVFRVVPLNPWASTVFPKEETMSEREYVGRLYALRGKVLGREMLAESNLDTWTPGND